MTMAVAALCSFGTIAGATNVEIGTNRGVLVDGRPFYPICAIHARWADVAHMGFNCALEGGIPTNDEMMTGYVHHRLEIPEFSGYIRSGDLAGARTAAAGLGDAPVLANYVIDEPHYSGLSPSLVRSQSSLIKRADPSHLTLVIDERDIAAGYARAADVIGLDVYPVRWTGRRYGIDGADSLALVGRYVAAVVEAAGARRPVWFVEQAHLIPSDRSYPDPARYPTPEEERVMAYEALNHGAAGLLFYAYGDHWGGVRGFAESPTLMSYLPQLIAEIKRMLPEYTHGSVVRLDAGPEVDAVIISYKGVHTTVAVNPTARVLDASLPCGRRITLDQMSVHVSDGTCSGSP